MKILFLEPYPTEGPSGRYRVEQYIPYLRDKGIECVVRPFASSDFYKIIYKKGSYFKKLVFFTRSCAGRLSDLFYARNCDIVFIHLEAFPLGPPLFEFIVSALGKKIIYDLDDAIYMGATSPANSFIKFLKWPSKIKKMIKISDYVITCNEYLADYVKPLNKNLTVIHTSVNTSKFLPAAKKQEKRLTIGWIGSHSTAPYLENIRNVFVRLGSKYDFDLKIIGASRRNVKIPNVSVINKDWSLEDEIEQFQSLDIGVYPLPDNEWVHGKTGFKTIQYMSVGIPCVVSDVGPNKIIVKDGVNGFLAKDEDDWVEKLSRLIENADLRQAIGAAGRETVVSNYSLKVNAPKLLDVIQRVYGK
ncbi:MAG: glycosyltransferase family 4 protein [Candidatus Omnitrophota bacterium]